MIQPTVITRTYDLYLPLNRQSILRRAGVAETTPEVEALLDDCLKSVRGVFTYRLCYSEYALKPTRAGLDLGFATTPSQDLARHLEGCDRMILFAATVGGQIDRMIRRNAVESPAVSFLLHNIGAEAIEVLCDTFCAEMENKMKTQGRQTRKRFSPGYGDLPIELQKPIFEALQCQHRIGLFLGERLLMTPSKSVTAIIGVENKK